MGWVLGLQWRCAKLNSIVLQLSSRTRAVYCAWLSVSNCMLHHDVKTSTGRTRYAHDLTVAGPLTVSYHRGWRLLRTSARRGSFAVGRMSKDVKVYTRVCFGRMSPHTSTLCCALARCERRVGD